jgi:hypothetical protein
MNVLVLLPMAVDSSGARSMAMEAVPTSATTVPPNENDESAELSAMDQSL